MSNPDPAAAQATSHSPADYPDLCVCRPRRWCRVCYEPVKLTGGAAYVSPWLARAVHEGTGLETGADGHLVSPVDVNPTPRGQADAIEAEFDGAFDMSVRFGFFRADYAHVRPGAVARHYEAGTTDGLRVQLRSALQVEVRS